MKRFWENLVVAFGMRSCFAGLPSFSQSKQAVADIPFSFVVGNKLLNAGTYRVSQLSLNSAAFRMENASGAAVTTQLGAPTEGSPEHPSLTFAREGSEWVLVKIVPPHSAFAYNRIGTPVHGSHNGSHIAALISVKLK